jgi:hypothetical protein
LLILCMHECIWKIFCLNLILFVSLIFMYRLVVVIMGIYPRMLSYESMNWKKWTQVCGLLVFQVWILIARFTYLLWIGAL